MYTSQSAGYAYRPAERVPVHTTTTADTTPTHWALVGTGAKHRTKKYPPRIKTTTMRVHELAREVGLSSKDTVNLLRRMGEYVTNGNSTIPTVVARDLLASL